jgi:tartrate-resistant acid phosphatase type 5
MFNMPFLVHVVLLTIIHGQKADDSTLWFAHLGDWGYASESGLGKTISSIQSDPSIRFVVLGGDNFYETGVSDVHDDQFNSTYKEYFNRLSPNIDRYMILGNHDYYGSAISQILYSQYDPTWYSPYYFYHKQINQDNFMICALFVDTYNIYQSGQIGFMHAILGSNECQHSDAIFVFGHHPLYSTGGHGDLDYMQEAIGNILVKYNVDVYVAGHDHILSCHLAKGVLHIVSGCASKKSTSSWYTSISQADETLFSNYGIYGYAKISIMTSGVIAIHLWNSETNAVLYSHEIMSKKIVRGATQVIPFDPSAIRGTRAMSWLNVCGLSFMIFLVWFVGAIAMQPRQISLAFKM